MNSISVIGTGAMGSALVRALLKNKVDVCAWNRSQEKTTALGSAGAAIAANFHDAMRASPIVLFCITDYEACHELLATITDAGMLSQKIIIQVSTGTPAQARGFGALVEQFGAQYLDGVMNPYPDEIGTPEARLVFAGSEQAYHRCEPLMQHFGGDVRYCGDDVGVPAALDLAELGHELATYAGVLHGLLICESENVPLELFASLFPKGYSARNLAEIVAENAYEVSSLHPGASVDVWYGVIKHLLSQGASAKIDRGMPRYLSDIFEQGIANGYGDEDIAALIKVLRSRSSADRKTSSEQQSRERARA